MIKCFKLLKFGATTSSPLASMPTSKQQVRPAHMVALSCSKIPNICRIYLYYCLPDLGHRCGILTSNEPSNLWTHGPANHNPSWIYPTTSFFVRFGIRSIPKNISIRSLLSWSQVPVALSRGTRRCWSDLRRRRGILWLIMIFQLPDHMNTCFLSRIVVAAQRTEVNVLLRLASVVILSPGFPLWTAAGLPSSEATAINPPCGEAKTAQAMKQ